MSVTYRVTGTIDFDRPVQLATFWELLEKPFEPWLIAPSNLTGRQLTELVHQQERLLLPSDDAVFDSADRPSHIKGLSIDWDQRSHLIGEALRAITRLVISIGHDLDDYDVAFFGEDGSEGQIEFYEGDDADLGWEESYAPGRTPSVFG